MYSAKNTVASSVEKIWNKALASAESQNARGESYSWQMNYGIKLGLLFRF